MSDRQPRMELQRTADLNVLLAVLLWILAAVMVGDGGIVAWVAILPFVLGWVGYGFALHYHGKAWK